MPNGTKVRLERAVACQLQRLVGLHAAYPRERRSPRQAPLSGRGRLENMEDESRVEEQPESGEC